MKGRRNRVWIVGRAAGTACISLAVWWLQGSPTPAQELIAPPPTLAAPPTFASPSTESTPAETVPAPAAVDPNVEVLTRGPIHEAYASPVTNAAGPGMVVPKRPPEPVEEQPPEVKPEGDHATWIPGYWSWDDDRKDFLWVSGVWRVAPNGVRWNPGYWQEAQGGWQWVSGYWIPIAKTEVAYLPKPPDTLDQGPTSPSPGETHVWVPGHWQWRLGHYVWVPGYWAVSQPDRVWVYPTYYWCPRGWVYCDGYWDYPLERRGLLFAPVYFTAPVRVYRPAVCVDVGAVSVSLFCRPAYRHYYFGDYYADTYVAIGFQPWFIYSGPRYGYDPLFCYYRAYHHRDPHWEANLRGWHDYYRGHPGMRPPHTLAAQQHLLADPKSHGRPDARNLAVGRPVGQLQKNPNGPIKVQPVGASQRVATQQSAKQMSGVASQRAHTETKGGQGGVGRVPGAGDAGQAGSARAGDARSPGAQSSGSRPPGPSGRQQPAQHSGSRSYNTSRGEGRERDAGGQEGFGGGGRGGFGGSGGSGGFGGSGGPGRGSRRP